MTIRPSIIGRITHRKTKDPVLYAPAHVVAFARKFLYPSGKYRLVCHYIYVFRLNGRPGFHDAIGHFTIGKRVGLREGRTHTTLIIKST